MEVVVWVVGGILALDVFTVGALWMFAAIRRHRTERRRRKLEAQWHVRKLPSATTPSRLRRVTGLGVAAALVWTLVALGGVEAGRVITSALEVVVPALGPEREGHGSRAAADRADEREPAPEVAGAPLGTDAEPAPPGSPSHSAGSPTDDPAAPATVAARSRSSSAIQLTWAQVSDATEYEVERWEDGEAEWLEIATTAEDVTVYTDDGLASGTTYYYRIVAITAAGEAAPSDVASATTPIAPPAATTLTASAASPVAIDLSWMDVADETGYRIERSADGTTDWITIATTGQDVTTYSDAGLSPGTTYHYRVVAANEGGDSPPSNVAVTTTPGGNGASTAVDPQQAEPVAGEAAADLDA